MGRPYSTEMHSLPATYRWARTADIGSFKEAVAAVQGLPLIIVGSGGSLSACHLARRLHESRARLMAHVLSPLEFLQSPKPQSAAVMLISAGGSNPDILAAADHASSSA